MKNMLLAFLFLLVIIGVLILSKNPRFYDFFAPRSTSQSLPTNSKQALTPTQPTKKITSSPTVTPKATAKIIVTPLGFSPTSIQVKVNTKISWINQSGSLVNISAYPTNKFSQLNIGNFGNNAVVFVILTKAGTYTYYNNLHSSERGTIIVN